MVMVYAFELWDLVRGRMVRQPLKSPLWRIQEFGGYPLDGTGEEVAEATLDADACYDPRQGGRAFRA